MLEEFAEAPTTRTAFYLAGTHKDAGRYGGCPVVCPAHRNGTGFRDEWLFAHLYKARCERASGDEAAAEKTLLEAVSKERSWAEFWTELSFVAYRQKRHWHVIGYALQAVDSPIPETLLWREPNMYTDQPLRMISWAYEHLGDNAQALAWALKAHAAIGTGDREWEQRIARLS
jgi:tetratricopeptide (TPR) repeat protein